MKLDPKLGGLLVAVVALVASAFFNVVQFRQVGGLQAQVAQMQSDPQAQAERENMAIIAAVGKLMVMPNETPTVATVTDPEKLKDQSFFANAKKGDKVLIFSGVKKAVLYDPVADRIIDVAPLQAAPKDDATNVNGITTPDKSSDADAKKPSTKKPAVESDASTQ